MKPTRIVRAIVLAATALVLSSCLKLDMDAVIDEDGTVDGTVIVGFSKTLADLMGDQMPDLDDFGSDAPEGVEVEEYEDDDYVGWRMTGENIPAEEFFNQSGGVATDEGTLTLEREGDTFVLRGVLDFSQGTEGGDLPFGEGLDADIRIRVTFPGAVLEANGDIDGNTVTWRPEIGERVELEAIGEAEDNGRGRSGDDDDGFPVLGFVIGAIVVAAVIVGIVVLAKRSKRTPPPPPPSGPPVDAAVAPPAPPTGPPVAGSPLPPPPPPSS